METIIELEVYFFINSLFGGSYTNLQCGFYSSYEKVEEAIKKHKISGFMYITKEYKLDCVDDMDDIDEALISTRQYIFKNDEAILMHETRFDFNGYISKPLYNVGDIVDFVGHDSIETGIIRDLPPSKEFGETHSIDSNDDRYTIYTLGDGDTHDHILSVHILGLSVIPEWSKKVFRAKLEERNGLETV